MPDGASGKAGQIQDTCSWTVSNDEPQIGLLELQLISRPCAEVIAYCFWHRDLALGRQTGLRQTPSGHYHWQES